VCARAAAGIRARATSSKVAVAEADGLELGLDDADDAGVATSDGPVAPCAPELQPAISIDTAMAEASARRPPMGATYWIITASGGERPPTCGRRPPPDGS
jgi:hypothetical protein